MMGLTPRVEVNYGLLVCLSWLSRHCTLATSKDTTQRFPSSSANPTRKDRTSAWGWPSLVALAAEHPKLRTQIKGWILGRCGWGLWAAHLSSHDTRRCGSCKRGGPRDGERRTPEGHATQGGGREHWVEIGEAGRELL